MRAFEILTEMAFEKKVAEGKVRAKEETINLHVIKLLAFDVEEVTKVYWRKEIFAETRFLSGISMRVGKKARHITAAQYFALLYTEPFDQNELPYTQALIDVAESKAEQGGSPMQRNNRPISDIATMVRQFQIALCPLLAAGNGGGELLARLGTDE
ncbi:unnamed protein product [Sphagnum tenellum]